MPDTPPDNKASPAEFVKTLGATGLFSTDDLNNLLASLPPWAADTDATSLASQLTSTGKLTPFQADAVLGRRANELVFGNYEVLEKLGSGGMGTVYKARHRRMKRVVAIKVLSRAVAPDVMYVQRFQREVETVARLSHPNIVMAFDADEAEVGPYLVMEFVDGRDLASRVQTLGRLRVADAVDCVLQVARGLAYAHSQGIVHRDIKPANLLQDVTGVVKVADLGLARLNDTRALGGGSGSLTQAGGVVGTVDYMPPEQAMDSTTIDHRADIYSLGCTFYFLMVGTPPYSAATLMGTLLKHQAATIPSVCAQRPEAPDAVDEICRKMMAKVPAERFQSMTEVIQALEALQRKLSAARPPVAGGGTSQPLESAPTILAAPAAKPTTPPSAKNRTVILVEPSRTQASIVRKFLQDLGVTDVRTCPSGEKALQEIRAARPDLVISAMHLADVTGVELAHQLRAEPECAGVGFVLVSSESEAEQVGDIHALLKAVVLPKPFDIQKLEQALGRASG